MASTPSGASKAAYGGRERSREVERDRKKGIMTLTDRGNESKQDKHRLFDLTDFLQLQQGKSLSSLRWECEVKCPTAVYVCLCVCV